MVIEVLRLYFHGKYRGGRKNTRCRSQMLSISPAKMCTHAQEALNILDCTCREDWALHIWTVEACGSISCGLGAQAPGIQAVHLQGSHGVGSLCYAVLHICPCQHQPLPVSSSGQLEKPFAALCHREPVSSFHQISKRPAVIASCLCCTALIKNQGHSHQVPLLWYFLPREINAASHQLPSHKQGRSHLNVPAMKADATNLNACE